MEKIETTPRPWFHIFSEDVEKVPATEVGLLRRVKKAGADDPRRVVRAATVGYLSSIRSTPICDRLGSP